MQRYDWIVRFAYPQEMTHYLIDVDAEGFEILHVVPITLPESVGMQLMIIARRPRTKQ